MSCDVTQEVTSSIERTHAELKEMHLNGRFGEGSLMKYLGIVDHERVRHFGVDIQKGEGR